MQLEEYISSGILELYVVGATTPEETLEIETLAKTHDLIRNEILKIEAALEHFAVLGKVDPKKDLKQQIWQQLHKGEQNSTKIIKMDYLKYYAIAASVLLMLSIGSNFILFTNLKTTKEKLEIAQTENSRIAEEVKIDKLNYSYALKEIDFLRNPNSQIVDLKPTTPEFIANAYVYWDTQNKEVYINVQKIPIPEGNKQYQLWALVDGKPVDMGVFEVGLRGLQKMNKVENAQAFAVTLEQFGGAKLPTSDILIVGKI